MSSTTCFDSADVTHTIFQAVFEVNNFPKSQSFIRVNILRDMLSQDSSGVLESGYGYLRRNSLACNASLS
jgi:hypothetical protein